MPRSAKAGPARSRRRPDPASQSNVNNLIFPLGNVTITPGIGSLTVTANAFNPITGVDIDADEIFATGKPTSVRFINTAGSIFTPAFTYNTGTGELRWAIASGLPADDYVATMPSLEPAIRGVLNQWIGTFFEVSTVT